jgi:glycosyltransferase involved in cell wall biosynthesis
MKILMVAPQPFYQERGTPIAVRLLVESLCDLGHEVDLLVYHDGVNVVIPGMTLIRAGKPPGVGRVPIGISWQKLVCDVWLVAKMIRLLFSKKYDVIHAVEEAVFPAVLFNLFSKRKLVYDMDSSLSDQLTDKWRLMKPLHPLLEGFERFTIRRATAVLAVCEDLAVKVRPWVGDDRVVVLPDVPVGDADVKAPVEDLRSITGPDAVIGLYVGNLERYQGIDLLLDGLAKLPRAVNLQVVIIGGDPAHVTMYREKAAAMGIADRLHFLGARPVAHLNAYLAQADVLVSPRTLGQNTPMKVYSYMQSGRAILATDIRSHTQALDRACAELVPPEAGALAAGLERLARDPELRRQLGNAARDKAQREYSLPVFRRKLKHAYEEVVCAEPVS